MKPMRAARDTMAILPAFPLPFDMRYIDDRIPATPKIKFTIAIA